MFFNFTASLKPSPTHPSKTQRLLNVQCHLTEHGRKLHTRPMYTFPTIPTIKRDDDHNENNNNNNKNNNVKVENLFPA
jgi:hypothetical protein